MENAIQHRYQRHMFAMARTLDNWCSDSWLVTLPIESAAGKHWTLWPDDLSLHVLRGWKLIIKDFDRQSVLSPAEVGALVRRLPKSHLQGLQTLLYKPMAEFMRLQIPMGASCKGAFYPEFRAIIVFDLVNKVSAAHILYHEIGHYVFHTIIGSYLKKAWVHQIFGKVPASTEYGRRNAVEDFAETYALYAQNPSTLATWPAKRQFMDKNVFKQP